MARETRFAGDTCVSERTASRMATAGRKVRIRGLGAQPNVAGMPRIIGPYGMTSNHASGDLPLAPRVAQADAFERRIIGVCRGSQDSRKAEDWNERHVESCGERQATFRGAGERHPLRGQW
jgi:hypothetical protein